MKLDAAKTFKEGYSVILKDLSSYGGFPFYGIVILAAIILMEFNFTLRLVASLLAVTIVVAAVRLTYFKPRPGMKKKNYETYYERIDNSSFPSIHAARAVMISIAFFSKAPVLLPLLVLLTVAVLLSRIHFKRHDHTDLVAGILIGLVLGIVSFF